jgi:hypothetical protein
MINIEMNKNIFQACKDLAISFKIALTIDNVLRI